LDGRGEFVFVQIANDSGCTLAIGSHLKNSFDNSCGCGIGNKLIWILAGFLIAKRGFRSNKFTMLCLSVSVPPYLLTDLYDQTKDIKLAQAAVGHTTSAMTLRYYVKGRESVSKTAAVVDRAYSA